MKAISVFPGKPNSVHVAELPKPSLDQVPNGRGVLVKVLRVGVDGTDKEINAAEYGAAPPGYDFLVIGHEGFGQVEAVAPEQQRRRRRGQHARKQRVPARGAHSGGERRLQHLARLARVAHDQHLRMRLA